MKCVKCGFIGDQERPVAIDIANGLGALWCLRCTVFERSWAAKEAWKQEQQGQH